VAAERKLIGNNDEELQKLAKIAAKEGKVEFFDVLASLNPQIIANFSSDKTDPEITAFMEYVLFSGKEKLFIELVKKNTKCKVFLKTNHNLLTLAAENNLTEVIKHAIYFEEIDKNHIHNTHTLIERAARNGHNETVKFLLSIGAGADFNNSDSLSFAISGGHNDVVKTLIEGGLDVNKPILVRRVEENGLILEGGIKDEVPPIIFAISVNFPDIVKTLMNSPNIDFSKAINSNSYDIKYIDALLIAVISNKFEMLKIMSAKKDKFSDAQKGKAMLEACINGNLSFVESLIVDWGVSVDKVPYMENGWLLHHANPIEVAKKSPTPNEEMIAMMESHKAKKESPGSVIYNSVANLLKIIGITIDSK
jgi:hypothetical protein